MERKKNYEQPKSAVTRVELESPICSGSAVIDNNASPMGISTQETNTSFDVSGAATGDNNGWEQTTIQ